MGFSVTWHLTLPGELPFGDVRERVEMLRARCLEMPFDRVTELTALGGNEIDDERCSRHVWGDLHFHISVDEQGRGSPAPEGDYHGSLLTAQAQEVVYFVAWPGRGCETANFGVARVPNVMSWVNPDRPELGAQEIPVPRHEGRWYGFAGSKTQYAAHPDSGGVNHFLKCHLGLIAALEEARSLGFSATVRDDGAYWTQRDPRKLLRDLHAWNQKVARIVGVFKDALEGKGVMGAPIATRTDFERLEAGGGSPEPPDTTDPVVADLLRRTGARI